MKKRILFFTTLIIAMAITIITFYNKNSVKADSINNNNELISYKISIPSNYYTGQKISKMILHYGINGWNNPQDVTMYVTTDDYHYGIPASYIYNAVIKVHKGDTINYCLKTINKNGKTLWNNNNGNNFSIVANESNVKTIEYEINWLSKSNNVNGDVTLHYGINGWDNPSNIIMDLKSSYMYNNKTYTWYKAIISVEEGSTINYCVKTETTDGSIWDNNNGANYSVIANQPYNK